MLALNQVNIPSPASWLSSVENKGHGEILARKVIQYSLTQIFNLIAGSQVDIKESVAELIATGLRRKNGISFKAWREVSVTLADVNHRV